MKRKGEKGKDKGYKWFFTISSEDGVLAQGCTLCLCITITIHVLIPFSRFFWEIPSSGSPLSLYTPQLIAS